MTPEHCLSAHHSLSVEARPVEVGGVGLEHQPSPELRAVHIACTQTRALVCCLEGGKNAASSCP